MSKNWIIGGLLCQAALINAHGSMNIPLPRNNAGQIPLDTPPGSSSGPSCLGDACGWFSAGCFTGCSVCSNASSGADVPCFPSDDPSTSNCDLLKPTLPDEFKTYNKKMLSPYGDWTANHPWRSPGRAPMGDSCGVSGAYEVGPGVSGYDPLFPGSQIPPNKPVVWKAGEVSEVGWSIWSNHGGGYQYRLCPKDQTPNEECFTANVLSFASNTTIIRSPYGDYEDFTITAKDVAEGTYPENSVWRMNPIPACNCDMGYNCTHTTGNAYSVYEESAGGYPCETGYQFTPPWDNGFGYWGSGAHYSGDSLLWSLVDTLVVPNNPGEYLLQWRWDCENSPQVWGNCADIEII